MMCHYKQFNSFVIMSLIDFEPKKIIVRMPNWIGDLVMATPVLTDLRKKFPNAEITAMCKKPIGELLEKDTEIDEIFCFTKPQNRFFEKRKEKRNIISNLRAGKYDLGILLTNSFSSAWWFWQGKVKNRLGYDGNFRNILLDYPIEKNKEEEHQVEFYKRLLLPLGIELSKTTPRLFLTDEELNESKELLKQQGYNFDKPLIGVNPTAQYGLAKCWPKEKYCKVIKDLIESRDCFVVCFGDEKSFETVKGIASSMPKNVINLAGITSLRELACLIKQCTVFLTNDSGPMHIADALNVPVIAIFGSTNPQRTGPYSGGTVISSNAECSPCYLRKCPIDFRCMQQITEGQVLTAILKQIDNNVKKNT